MKPVIVNPFPYGRNESIALHDVGALTCGHGGALTRGHCVGRAIAPHDCSGPQSLSVAEGCHRGLQGWARATCGMRLIGEMADLHPRDGECFTMYSRPQSPEDFMKYRCLVTDPQGTTGALGNKLNNRTRDEAQRSPLVPSTCRHAQVRSTTIPSHEIGTSRTRGVI